MILPKTLRRLGEKTLPPAAIVSLERFLSGAVDVQRVQVSGVVQSVVDDDTSWRLKVETGLGHFITHLPKTPVFSPTRLLDAEVRMTGLAAASRNWRSEFICPRLMISREENVIVEKAAPDDPFAAPEFPLKA